MVSLTKSLSVKGFGFVSDCTYTYLILNVQSCRLQLEPSLDTMAPEMVCLRAWSCKPSTKAYWMRHSSSDKLLMRLTSQCGIEESAATSEDVEDSGQTPPEQ